jgi:hypothetical protein
MTFNATLIIPPISVFYLPSEIKHQVCDFTDGLKCEILISLMLSKIVVSIMQFRRF